MLTDGGAVAPAFSVVAVLGAMSVQLFFFDAEKHPVVSFSGSDIKRDGNKVEIDGEVTIKGISQPAKLTGTVNGPSVDHFGANRIGFELETTVDRTTFDMNWNMPLPNGEPALGNDVTLKAELTLVAQEA